MDKNRKEELKKNDLADIIEGKLAALKPYAGVIGVVGLLLVLGVGAIIWMLVSSHEKKNQQWADVYSANYAAQWENTSKLLDNTAVDPALEGTLQGLWAKQFAADFHMNAGCRTVQQDREKGFKQIESAKEMFKSVALQANKSKNPLLWSRSHIGWGRAAEATGDYEEAKTAYSTLAETASEIKASEFSNSPVAKFAQASLKRVSHEENSTRTFLAEFKVREPPAPPKPPEEAPGSDTELPPRWDFSYPESKIPDPDTLGTEVPPGPGDEESPLPPGEDKTPDENDGKESNEKTNEKSNGDSKESNGDSKESAEKSTPDPKE